jgi:outer membrane protein OmpA-like peptidoglycan-associated protein
MSKAKACKCKHVECEECPEWIFTFADLVMLMMGFFVILWVLKPPAGKSGASDSEQVAAQKQWIDTVGEIRKGFGYEPSPRSADPVDVEMIQKTRGIKNGAENEQTRETPPGTDHDPTALRPGKQAIVGSRLLFDAGSLTITPESITALDDIADKLRGHNEIVLVKGHTSLDDLPDTGTSPQRMDLSLRRAQAVADWLMAKGVAPDALRVQGCSTFEPIHQHAYKAEEQAENRRVEIEWTSQLISDRQDGTNTPEPPLADKLGSNSFATTKPAEK